MSRRVNGANHASENDVLKNHDVRIDDIERHLKHNPCNKALLKRIVQLEGQISALSRIASERGVNLKAIDSTEELDPNFDALRDRLENTYLDCEARFQNNLRAMLSDRYWSLAYNLKENNPIPVEQAVPHLDELPSLFASEVVGLDVAKRDLGDSIASDQHNGGTSVRTKERTVRVEVLTEQANRLLASIKDNLPTLPESVRDYREKLAHEAEQNKAMLRAERDRNYLPHAQQRSAPASVYGGVVQSRR